MCETYATSNKHTYNIRLKKHMKHLKRTLATYMYNHCNMCNITIYFCNIHMKHLVVHVSICCSLSPWALQEIDRRR
jgi:hypothetical protein